MSVLRINSHFQPGRTRNWTEKIFYELLLIIMNEKCLKPDENIVLSLVSGKRRWKTCVRDVPLYNNSPQEGQWLPKPDDCVAAYQKTRRHQTRSCTYHGVITTVVVLQPWSKYIHLGTYMLYYILGGHSYTNECTSPCSDFRRLIETLRKPSIW